MLNLIFIILCLVVIYHHVIFPIVLKFRKPVVLDNTDTIPSSYPSIIMIVPAYNEASYISQKIANLSSLQYPADKLKIIVACDGCTDDTAALARVSITENNDSNHSIELIDFQMNRGKISVLNELITSARTEIVALSDVSAILPKDCLTMLATNFTDPKVGAVGGSYHFDQSETDTAEQAYWKYQRDIKVGEASFGAPLGMHGAFYAFRRDQFILLAPDTINDDFILPMSIVAQGYKAIYNTEIQTIEKEHSSADMNWNRRVRISAGNIQQTIRLGGLLAPRYGGVAFSFFSGKFLRAWMPFLLLSIFMLSIILANGSLFFQALVVVQMLITTSVFIPISNTFRISKVQRLLRYLIVGYAAGFIGAVRYLTGLEKGKWMRVHS